MIKSSAKNECKIQFFIYHVMFIGFMFSLQIFLSKNKAISAGI